MHRQKGNAVVDLAAAVRLELHARLLTESKISCGCSTVFEGKPNTRVCPVCLGIPEVLPVLS